MELTAKKNLALLLIILAIGAFFRFYRLTSLPPGLYPDEAMNGNNALEAIKTGDYKLFYPENNGREGLFINLQAISIIIFGNKAWALRIVSALFGTLTILGLYLVTKELLGKNYQFSIINFQSKPNYPIPKSLKIGKLENLLIIENWKIENSEVISLLASFFLATSYWHINFSRIGFRAITVPFFTVFAFYFLLKALRNGKTSTVLAAGIFTGLGFYTYIAYRLVPVILAFILGWYLWQWRKKNQNDPEQIAAQFNGASNPKIKIDTTCVPCVTVLFLFVTFVTALPIGYYFLTHRENFSGRQNQVSIFSAASPVKEFLISGIKTAGMFNIRGDCNQRHNLSCRPELQFIVGIFFIIGLLVTIKKSLKFQIPRYNNQTISNNQKTNGPNTRFWKFKNWNLFENLKFKIENYNERFPYLLLLIWLIVMSLPALLTKEGLPHALRSIGMIPPVFIISGLGAYFSFFWFSNFAQKKYGPDATKTKKGLLALYTLLSLFIIFSAYHSYFRVFAEDKETAGAFSKDLYDIGNFLNGLSPDIQKFIIINMDGEDVRGLPMPAQTVMFLTDTFRAESQKERGIHYLLPSQIPNIKNELVGQNGKFVIIPMNQSDTQTIQKIVELFPKAAQEKHQDFMMFQGLN